MSEYQYYEFQAVDRPLNEAARAALRAISSRARITATSFVNSYEWGDLKADPLDLLKRHFDLFLYLANWGTRRFALRLPRRLIDLQALDRFQLDEEIVSLKVVGEHLLIDIHREDEGADDWEEDGSGWLAALAPLRAELLGGKLQLLTLLWVMQVEYDELIPDEAVMPAPGLATLSGPLAALAEFLCINPDLLDAATQQAPVPSVEPSPAAVEAFLRALPEDDKVALLFRLQAGDDPHLGAELRRRCREAIAPPAAAVAGLPTAGDLRNAARRLGEDRRRVAEERVAAERHRREQDQAQARARHLAALAKRGEALWGEVEEQIALRNAYGYDRAAALLADLGEIAAKDGTGEAFAERLAGIRLRHDRKGRFIERLDAAGLP